MPRTAFSSIPRAGGQIACIDGVPLSRTSRRSAGPWAVAGQSLVDAATKSIRRCASPEGGRPRTPRRAHPGALPRAGPPSCRLTASRWCSAVSTGKVGGVGLPQVGGCTPQIRRRPSMRFAVSQHTRRSRSRRGSLREVVLTVATVARACGCMRGAHAELALHRERPDHRGRTGYPECPHSFWVTTL